MALLVFFWVGGIIGRKQKEATYFGNLFRKKIGNTYLLTTKRLCMRLSPDSRTTTYNPFAKFPSTLISC